MKPFRKFLALSAVCVLIGAALIGYWPSSQYQTGNLETSAATIQVLRTSTYFGREFEPGNIASRPKRVRSTVTILSSNSAEPVIWHGTEHERERAIAIVDGTIYLVVEPNQPRGCRRYEVWLWTNDEWRQSESTSRAELTGLHVLRNVRDSITPFPFNFFVKPQPNLFNKNYLLRLNEQLIGCQHVTRKP